MKLLNRILNMLEYNCHRKSDDRKVDHMYQNSERTAIVLVDYLKGSAVVHEFMSADDFARLQAQEESGNVRIMNHYEPLREAA